MAWSSENSLDFSLTFFINDKKCFLAAIYDKHITTFQTVIFEIQTFSICAIFMVVFVCKRSVVYV